MRKYLDAKWVCTNHGPRTERPTITASYKRLLCRRQDATELLPVVSSNGVYTEEINAFPRQAIPNRQKKHLEMYSNNASAQTSGTNFEAHDQERPYVAHPLSKNCRQRRLCVVETVQNEDNRWNRRTAVCLATDTTIRDREHARVVAKRF